MAWACPSCGLLQEDEYLKCACGHILPTALPAKRKDRQDDLHYAGFWRRLASILIDGLIWLPFVFFPMFLPPESRAINVLMRIVVCLLGIGYSVCFIAKYGQTPGKKSLRIKVVKVNGEPVSWKEAILRHSVDSIFGVLGAVAVCIAIIKIPSSEFAALNTKARLKEMQQFYPVWHNWVTAIWYAWAWSEIFVLLFNKRRRALHDFIAGTVVVHAGKKVKEADIVDDVPANSAAQFTP